MCNPWLTEKMPNFLDNSSHFVLFVLVEIEDVTEFLTFGRNNVERWLLDNFSRFVLFALVEIKDAVEFLTDRRHCRASLIIPAILFYSGLLETLKTLRNSWLTDEVLSSVLDNYNHFVPLVLPIFKDGGEFLTERRNIVERSLLDNSSHFVLFVLREIEDVAEFFTWKTKYCRAFLKISAILFFLSWLKLKTLRI